MINEASVGIGDTIKLNTPINGHHYGHVKGFAMGKGASVSPKGLPSGPVSKIRIQTKSHPYASDYSSTTHEVDLGSYKKLDARERESEYQKHKSTSAAPKNFKDEYPLVKHHPDTAHKNYQRAMELDLVPDPKDVAVVHSDKDAMSKTIKSTINSIAKNTRAWQKEKTDLKTARADARVRVDRLVGHANKLVNKNESTDWIFDITEEELMENEINESPFSGIANTLKKYGGTERIKDEPKKVAPKRSAFHGDIAMTGHKEKINKDGSRSYSKVLPDHDDDTEVKQVAAVQKDVAKQTGAPEPVKRGRGRPKGVGAKAGSYKPRDPAKKAASAAKAAATKAANKAARAALTKEDLDEFLEGFGLEEMVDFMLSEDVQGMDELSKKTLGSYIRKAATDMTVSSHGAANGNMQKFKKVSKRFDGINRATRKMEEEVDEATDTEVRDPKTGKLKSWKHEGDWKKAKGTVTDKSGAKHTDMSRARDMARKAIEKETNEEVSIEEATHLVHTKLADGRPGPKIKLSAIDGDNADFQAKKLIGQKPYRGHTIDKIEKIEKKVNESTMDKYVNAVGGNVFGKLAR